MFVSKNRFDLLKVQKMAIPVICNMPGYVERKMLKIGVVFLVINGDKRRSNPLSLILAKISEPSSI